MKLPAIVSPIYDKSIAVIVFDDSQTKENAIHLKGMHKGNIVNYSINGAITNITREYLSNTWGVVESKEHAEFIIELAVNCDYSPSFAKRAMAEGGVNWFFFSESENELQFFENDVSDSFYESEGEKQITIPLPPKAKEWPQVGDEVVTRGGSKGVLLIGKTDKDGVVVCDFDGEYALAYLNELQKPKSKQDLLIEELQTKLCNNNAADNYILACDIINGEIEGLNYESK